MQIHGPSEVVQGIEVTRLSASGSVALSFTGGFYVIMQSETDFDDLIRAAVAGKTLFLGKDDLSAAIVADVDAQTARVWAVFEDTDGPREDTQVTDPKTWAEARTWATVNAMSFDGELYVDRARTDLDAQLTPPATRGRDTDRPPTGYQLPAAARCDGEWRTGAAFGQCTGVPDHRGQCMDKTGHRWLRAAVGSDA